MANKKTHEGGEIPPQPENNKTMNPELKEALVAAGILPAGLSDDEAQAKLDAVGVDGCRGDVAAFERLGTPKLRTRGGVVGDHPRVGGREELVGLSDAHDGRRGP